MVASTDALPTDPSPSDALPTDPSPSDASPMATTADALVRELVKEDSNAAEGEEIDGDAPSDAPNKKVVADIVAGDTEPDGGEVGLEGPVGGGELEGIRAAGGDEGLGQTGGVT
eukprot:254293-Amorphochlora_amoeboformis.AAC.3